MPINIFIPIKGWVKRLFNKFLLLKVIRLALCVAINVLMPEPVCFIFRESVSPGFFISPAFNPISLIVTAMSYQLATPSFEK